MPLLTRHPVDWESFFSILLERPWVSGLIVSEIPYVGSDELSYPVRDVLSQCCEIVSCAPQIHGQSEYASLLW